MSRYRAPSPVLARLLPFLALVCFLLWLAYWLSHQPIHTEPETYGEPRYAIRKPDCTEEAHNAIVGDLWDCMRFVD